MHISWHPILDFIYERLWNTKFIHSVIKRNPNLLYVLPVPIVSGELYSVHSIVWNVQCELYSVHSIVWNVQCGMFSVECTVWNV